TKSAAHDVEEIQTEICILHGVGHFLPSATSRSPTSKTNLSFFDRIKIRSRGSYPKLFKVTNFYNNLWLFMVNLLTPAQPQPYLLEQAHPYLVKLQYIEILLLQC
ncbi:MAG: hypothetical protein RLZZ176_2066, partial [Cyanobacteriota bacterium]